MNKAEKPSKIGQNGLLRESPLCFILLCLVNDGYLIADGAQSCTDACQRRGNGTCNEVMTREAATSTEKCKSVIEGLGITIKKEKSSTHENAGCVNLEGEDKLYILQKPGEDVDCSDKPSRSDNQRVCYCEQSKQN